MTTTTTAIQEAKNLQEEIVALRRRIHENPELSFKEFETAELAAEKLAELGYKVKKKVGKTGVTGELGEGIAIGIRADMDALPIKRAIRSRINRKTKV